MKKQSIEGLRTRKTVNGLRYLMSVKRPDGKEVMQTVPIDPRDSEATIKCKCEAVRAELLARISPEATTKEVSKTSAQECANTPEARMHEAIEQYIKIHLRPSSAIVLRRVLKNFTIDDEKANDAALQAIIERDVKDSSKRTWIAYIKAFYTWLRERGLSVRNPACDVKLPPKGEPRRRLPTDEETERIISIAARIEHMKSTKLGAPRVVDHTGLELFCRLMCCTGARVSTIRALKCCDLDRNGLLTLYNVKSQKRYDVRIPCNDPEIPKLWKDLASGRSPSELLFFSEVYGMRLTKCLQGQLQNFGPDENGENISCHSFRHGVASKMLRAGVPIETISKILDHSTIAITLSTYARHNDSQIAEAFAAIK